MGTKRPQKSPRTGLNQRKKPDTGPQRSQEGDVAPEVPESKPALMFTDLVIRAAKSQLREQPRRTPVKTRVKRLEASIHTPEIKGKSSKRLGRMSNMELSPRQKKIESFFLKKTSVGRTGLSRDSNNTTHIQGLQTIPFWVFRTAVPPSR